MNAIKDFICEAKENSGQFPVVRISAEIIICKCAPISGIDLRTIKRQICDALELAVAFREKVSHEQQANV